MTSSTAAHATPGGTDDDGLPVDTQRLGRFTQDMLAACGMPAADAEILANHLLWAELRGISWLGLSRLPEYAARLRAGTTSATGREPKITFQRGGFMVVDAENTFGHVVGYRVMKQLIDAARVSGVSTAVIGNTTSAGALGSLVSLAVDEGMIGLAFTNGPPVQPAPGGGIDKVLGSQAFAVASPAGQSPPLVLDMATTAITLEQVDAHRQRGDLLPEGVAVTADGRPTVDPVAALDGILLPLGGHKNFGLALLWEVLTGVLAASTSFSTDVGPTTDSSRVQGVSMMLLVMDPTVSMPYETFTSRVDDLIDRIHRSRRVDGSEPVSLPGERAAHTMARRQSEGIPLPAALRGELRALAAELGVDAPL